MSDKLSAKDFQGYEQEKIGRLMGHLPSDGGLSISIKGLTNLSSLWLIVVSYSYLYYGK